MRKTRFGQNNNALPSKERTEEENEREQGATLCQQIEKKS